MTKKEKGIIQFFKTSNHFQKFDTYKKILKSSDNEIFKEILTEIFLEKGGRFKDLKNL